MHTTSSRSLSSNGNHTWFCSIAVYLALRCMQHFTAYVFLAAFSLALYGNTWSAGFAFDDNFAVVNNGDVTGSASLGGLLHHDFWGQQFTSEQSHKSYRPVTVLSLRLVNKFGKLLPHGARWHHTDKHDNTGGLNPFPFHLANTLVHALNSCLVFRLALSLVVLRSPGGAHLSAAGQQATAHVSSKDHQAWQQTVEAYTAAVLFAAHPIHTEAVAGVVGHAELVSAALALLALMVYLSAARAADWRLHYKMLGASVIMLWSAALAKELGITMAGAMILIDIYILPWPRRGSTSLQQHVGQLATSTKTHRLLVIASAVVAYAKLRSWLAINHLVSIYRKIENPIPFADSVTARLTTGYLHAKYCHLLLFPLRLSPDWSFACIPYVHAWSDPRNAATAVLYAALLWVVVSCRPWQVVQHVLYGPHSCNHHLHEMAPGSASASSTQTKQQQQQQQQQQQAPATEQHDTAPNTESELAVFSKPEKHQEAIWQMVIVIGLIVGPFFPAANVLFYVGTFIGERLLYLPSLGYCMLLSHGLMKLMGNQGIQSLTFALSCIGIRPHAVQSDCIAQPSAGYPASKGDCASDSLLVATQVGSSQLGDTSSSKDRPGKQQRQQQREQQQQQCNTKKLTQLRSEPVTTRQHVVHMSASKAGERMCTWLGLALLGMLLVGYSWRTVTRNLDWEDEETLFVAAQQVCLNSGKVRLNSGILERRHSQWDKALHHFRKAREVDDTYCEPDYWIGATLLQQGKHIQLALAELEKALSCKYVAANALNALQQVYQLMGNSSKDKAQAFQAWASILLKPELGRVVEACQLLEQVALEKVHLGGSYAQAQDIMKPCLEHIRHIVSKSQQGTQVAAAAKVTPNSNMPLLVTYSNTSLNQLASCSKARLRVMKALSLHKADSIEMQQGVYKYLQHDMPSCRLLQSKDGDNSGREVATSHMHLIHLVQSADSADPWFQHEWGEIMALQNRAKEAVLHLQVAAALFVNHIDQIVKGKRQGIAGAQHAAQLAVTSLRRARQMPASDVCQTLKSECEIYSKLQSVLPSASTAQELNACQQVLAELACSERT